MTKGSRPTHYLSTDVQDCSLCARENLGVELPGGSPERGSVQSAKPRSSGESPFGVLHPTGNSLLPPFPQEAAKMLQKGDNAQASPQGRQLGPCREGTRPPAPGNQPRQGFKGRPWMPKGRGPCQHLCPRPGSSPRAGKERDMASDEDEAALGVTETCVHQTLVRGTRTSVARLQGSPTKPSMPSFP